MLKNLASVCNERYLEVLKKYLWERCTGKTDSSLKKNFLSFSGVLEYKKVKEFDLNKQAIAKEKNPAV